MKNRFVIDYAETRRLLDAEITRLKAKGQRAPSIAYANPMIIAKGQASKLELYNMRDFIICKQRRYLGLPLLPDQRTLWQRFYTRFISGGGKR